MSGLESRSNFEILSDCLSVAVVNAVTQRERGSKTKNYDGKKKAKLDAGESEQNEAEELQDFIEYLVNELWENLPADIQSVSYEKKTADASEKTGTIESCNVVLDTLPVSYTESLVQAKMAEDDDDVRRLTTKALESYFEAACAPPQKWVASKTDECEMCGRNVALTYHHLIPRSTHVRVLKKAIHPEHMLNRVAWLCRPCHSTVHHVEDNMELAKNWYTMDLLLEREDIQRWITYISKRPGKIKGK